MEKRIKVRHPYDPEMNICFGCGRNNPVGLKLDFEESETHLHASWKPDVYYQGYANVLHGGIAATLLDEIGAWCIYVKAGTAAVTQTMTTRYLSPVFMNKGTITLDAAIISTDGKNARLFCRLFDGSGKQCIEAEIDYFLYSEEVARKRYNYPGHDAFYFKDENGEIGHE